MSELEFKTKSGIEDMNELFDKLTEDFTIKTDNTENISTRDGRARAHARASNHGNGQSSYEIGVSAAALKHGNKELLVAGSNANAQNGVYGVAANARASLTYYQDKNNNGGVEVLKADVGGGVGAGVGGVKAKVGAGVTLVGVTN